MMVRKRKKYKLTLGVALMLSGATFTMTPKDTSADTAKVVIPKSMDDGIRTKYKGKVQPIVKLPKAKGAHKVATNKTAKGAPTLWDGASEDSKVTISSFSLVDTNGTEFSTDKVLSGLQTGISTKFSVDNTDGHIKDGDRLVLQMSRYNKVSDSWVEVTNIPSANGSQGDISYSTDGSSGIKGGTLGVTFNKAPVGKGTYSIIIKGTVSCAIFSTSLDTSTQDVQIRLASQAEKTYKLASTNDTSANFLSGADLNSQGDRRIGLMAQETSAGLYRGVDPSKISAYTDDPFLVVFKYHVNAGQLTKLSSNKPYGCYNPLSSDMKSVLTNNQVYQGVNLPDDASGPMVNVGDKLSQDEFIAKAKALTGNRHIYSSTSATDGYIAVRLDALKNFTFDKMVSGNKKYDKPSDLIFSGDNAGAADASYLDAFDKIVTAKTAPLYIHSYVFFDFLDPTIKNTVTVNYLNGTNSADTHEGHTQTMSSSPAIVDMGSQTQVKVHYIDNRGNVIPGSKIDSGLGDPTGVKRPDSDAISDDQYSASPQNYKGYSLVTDETKVSDAAKSVIGSGKVLTGDSKVDFPSSSVKTADVYYVYDADEQKAKVTYYDDDTGKAVSTDDLTGVSGDKESYGVTTPKGYDLSKVTFDSGASGNYDSDNKKIDFTYDNDADVDQNMTVHLTHHHTKVADALSTNYTVMYRIDSGTHSDKLPDKVTPISWNTDTDEVTDTVTYTPSESNIKVDSPYYQGYTPDKSSASWNLKVTTTKPTDDDQKVFYDRNPQKANIIFVDDDDNGKEIKTDVKTMKSDQVGNPRLNAPDGYDVSKVESDDNILYIPSQDVLRIEYDHDDQKDQTATVHLTHHHTKVADALSTKYTVKYTVKGYASSDVNLQDKVTDISWNSDTDEVTKTATYTPSKTKVTVTNPTIKGYTPTEDVTSWDLSDTTTKPTDQDKTVDYTADEQKAKVTYVDDDDNSKVVSTDDLKGVSNDATSYAVNTPKGYDVSKVTFDDGTTGDYTDGKINFTYDADAKVDQGVTVHLSHHHTKVSDAVDNTYVVKYTANGQPSDKFPDNVTHIKWDTDTDEVTGTVNYIPSEDNVTVDVPDIKGYTPDDKSVSWNLENTTTKPADQTKMVNYTAGDQKATVTYVDDDDNAKVLSTDSLTGTSDLEANYDVTTPKGYDVSKVTFGNTKGTYDDSGNKINFTYDNDSDVSQSITVHLSHHHTKKTDAFNNKYTVHYTIEGKPSDKLTDKVAEVTWDTDTDEVSGKIIYTPHQDTVDVASPDVSGFTPDQKSVTWNLKAVSTKPEDTSTKTVDYTKADVKTTITYVTSDGKQVGNAVVVDGKAGESASYTLELLDGYTYVTRKSTGITVTKDDSDNLDWVNADTDSTIVITVKKSADNTDNNGDSDNNNSGNNNESDGNSNNGDSNGGDSNNKGDSATGSKHDSDSVDTGKEKGTDTKGSHKDSSSTARSRKHAKNSGNGTSNATVNKGNDSKGVDKAKSNDGSSKNSNTLLPETGIKPSILTTVIGATLTGLLAIWAGFKKFRR